MKKNKSLPRSKQKKSFIEPRMYKEEYIANFGASATMAVVGGVVGAVVGAPVGLGAAAVGAAVGVVVGGVVW